jgi:hypothetical protein
MSIKKARAVPRITETVTIIAPHNGPCVNKGARTPAINPAKPKPNIRIKLLSAAAGKLES